MSPAKKALLGIASFVPAAVGVVCFTLYLGMFRDMMLHSGAWQRDPQQMAPELFGRLREIYLWAIPGFCVTVALMILFILHAVRSRILSEGERVVWIIAFVVAGAIAFPLYFFMRIFSEQRTAAKDLATY